MPDGFLLVNIELVIRLAKLRPRTVYPSEIRRPRQPKILANGFYSRSIVANRTCRRLSVRQLLLLGAGVDLEGVEVGGPILGSAGTDVAIPTEVVLGTCCDDRSRAPCAAPAIHHGDRRHAHHADGLPVGAPAWSSTSSRTSTFRSSMSPGTIPASPPRTWNAASCWSASAPIRPRSTASSASNRCRSRASASSRSISTRAPTSAAPSRRFNAQNNSILRIAPPGITPPNMIRFNASNVPVVQVTLNSKTLPEQQIFDYGLNFLRVKLFTIPGLSIPGALRRQAAADHRRRRSRAGSAPRASRRWTWSTRCRPPT